MRETNLFFDPQIEKNRVQHGKNIYFESMKFDARAMREQQSHE